MRRWNRRKCIVNGPLLLVHFSLWLGHIEWTKYPCLYLSTLTSVSTHTWRSTYNNTVFAISFGHIIGYKLLYYIHHFGYNNENSQCQLSLHIYWKILRNHPRLNKCPPPSLGDSEFPKKKKPESARPWNKEAHYRSLHNTRNFKHPASCNPCSSYGNHWFVIPCGTFSDFPKAFQRFGTSNNAEFLIGPCMIKRVLPIGHNALPTLLLLLVHSFCVSPASPSFVCLCSTNVVKGPSWYLIVPEQHTTTPVPGTTIFTQLYIDSIIVWPPDCMSAK